MRSILEDIAFLKDAGIERILQDKELRFLFHQTAVAVFGENCLNCDSKIRLKFNQLINHKNPLQMSKIKYRMKEGSVISMNNPNWKEDISNANLTNAKAEMLLNTSLAYIKYFTEAPDIEKLRKLSEQGVKSLKEAIKSGASTKASKSEPQDSLKDALIALDGIGAGTADKLIKVYPTKDVLMDAIIADVEMPFLGNRESAVKDSLKKLK